MGLSQWVRRPGNVIGAIIIGGFILFLGYLFLEKQGQVLRGPSASFVKPEGSQQEWEEWYGVYFQGKKIGFGSESRHLAPEGYQYRDHTHLWLNVSGKEVSADSNIEVLVDKGLRLRSFTFHLRSAETDFEVDGNLEGNILNLGVSIAGERTEQAVQVDEPPVLGPIVRDYLFSDQDKRIEPGRKLSVPFLDPSFLADAEIKDTLANAELQIEVLGMEEMKIGDEVVSLYRLKESFKGIEAISWVTPNGRTIKEYSPTGFVIIREPREQAEQEEIKTGALPDIITALSVPVSGMIEKPRESRYLKAKLEEVVLDGFQINGHRQKLVEKVVEVRREDLEQGKSYVIPWSRTGDEPEEMEAYLKSTLFIPLEKGVIAENAALASGGHDDSLKAARAIMIWVYENLEKEPTFSIPNALQILEMKKGDCNEHALLFTALARAVGIPARTVVGVVYLEQKFYYHAWAEVYVGKGGDGWVSVDPTFGQMPADATHIRFISGDLNQQMEIARFVNFLKVEIIESE